MAVLVTGCAGFIGYHVADRLLARGEQVIGIDNFNDYYSPQLKRDRAAELHSRGGSFRLFEIDFADHEALNSVLAAERIERIVHLGAQPGVRYSITHPHTYAHSNLVGHLAILELARARKVQHLVYASSSSVYGGSARLPFRVEDRTDHPLSLYAATKRSNELMSETYANLYRIPQTGLRFFTVYGPWGRPDMAVWSFTEAVFEGRPIEVFNNGDMRRDFTFIDDIVTGVIACLDRAPADDGAEKPGGSHGPHALYNIGNSRSEELTRLIDLIEAAVGRPAIRKLRPMQPGDAKETFADISAIERDLGFRPTSPIDEGIPRFVDWYRGYRGR